MLARQHQLDLRLVKGSGRKGRIHKEDIVNYLAGKRSLEAKADDKAISGNNNMQISAFTKSGTLVVKMNTLEQDMQKSMSNSLAIPHLYLHERCDVGKLQHFRRSLKDNGRKVSLLSILIKTFSLSLSQHPKLNSSYDAKSPFNYITHHNHNVSIAIDSPYGRVIPNIKHVQSLSMLKLQAELDSLHQKAHNGILN